MTRGNYSPNQSATKRPDLRHGSRFVDGARRALLVVTVAAGCYVAYGFGTWLAEWRHTGPALQPSVSAAVHLQPMAAVLPLAGQWSFAELDWDLQSCDVAAGEVDALLTSLADKPAAHADEQLPDISADLIQFAESLNIEPVERGGHQVYRLHRDDLKALLVVRIVDGKAKAVALAAACPQGAKRWKLLEITPRTSTARLVGADHLLPLPRGAARSGGRFADDGTLLLELVTLESHADQLLAQWQAAGWEVHPSGLGGPDDFSYLCARGNEVIYAWSANPRDALHNLMLVRSPDSTDTKP